MGERSAGTRPSNTSFTCAPTNKVRSLLIASSMAFTECSRPTIKGVTTLGNRTVLRIGNTGSSSSFLSGKLFLSFVRFLVAVRAVGFVTIHPLSTEIVYSVFLNYNALQALNVKFYTMFQKSPIIRRE